MGHEFVLPLPVMDFVQGWIDGLHPMFAFLLMSGLFLFGEHRWLQRSRQWRIEDATTRREL